MMLSSSESSSQQLLQQEQQHRTMLLRLNWPKGRAKVQVGCDLTLHDLGEDALRRTGYQQVRLTIMPSRRTLEWKNNHALVCDTVEHMTRIDCAEVEAISLSEKKRTSSLESEVQEKAAAPANKKSKLVVDLTEDGTDSNDDNAAAAQMMDRDEALARQLQEEETRQYAKRTNNDHTNTASSDVPFKNVENLVAQLPQDPRDPTTVTTNDYWIWQMGPQPYAKEPILGKWLVFAGEKTVATTWRKIAVAVQSGTLHAAQAKVATAMNNHSHPGKSSSYVICVYTSQARMDEVGLQLIPLVQKELRYKTDEATARGHYSYNKNGPVSHKTLFWNNGRPSATKTQPLWTKTKSQLLASQVATCSDSPLTVTFTDRMVSLVALEHHYYKQENRPPLQQAEVVLVREPSNAYDPNAIRVNLKLADDSSKTQVGYILGKQAAVLAPWMDQNLIQVERAVVHHLVGESTATLQVQGKACARAQPLLDCF